MKKNGDKADLSIMGGVFDEDVSALLAEGAAQVDGRVVYFDPDVSEYAIDSAEDLRGFAALVNAGNDFKGKTVKLTASIDLAGENWIPIGNNTNYFKGTFDGGNNTISNMTIDVNAADKDQFLGLFGGVQNAVIKNLTMKDANITAVGKKVCAAAVVGIADSDKATPAVLALNFENITVDGCEIDAEAKSGSALLGGVVGYSYPANMKSISVSELTINGKAEGENEVRAAAINGYVCGQNISNNGSTRMAFTVDTFNVKDVDITAEAYTVFAGGYAPYTYYGYITLKDGAIENLKIDVDAHEAFVGGLVGYFWRSDNGHTVKNVDITGIDFDVTTDYLGENPVNYHAKVGGFVARTYEYAQQTYTNCVADVDVTGSHVAGGFVGNHNSTVSYVNCEARGDVTADIAGGFAGRLTEHGYTTDVTFNGCKASGNVKGANVAGGFIGSTADYGWGNAAGTPYGKNITLSNCEAADSVTGDGDVCGVVGELLMADGIELTMDEVVYTVQPAYLPVGANVATYVAQVGGNKHKTLAGAVSAANAIEGGATVKLLKDVSVDSTVSVVGNVEIDGQGNSITWADGYAGTLFDVAAGASLSTKNLTIDGENAFAFYSDTTTVENGQP